MGEPMKLDAATIDRLRELGATDDMLKWLEHPDAVRTLLERSTWDDRGCPSCGADSDDSHYRECAVSNAIFTLGHREAERAMLLAWLEAEDEDIRRSRYGPVRPPPQINVVASPYMKDGEAFLLDTSTFAEQYRRLARHELLGEKE